MELEQEESLSPGEQLWTAVNNADVALLRAAKHAGADIHAKNDAAMYFAVKLGHEDIVDQLLKWGAKPDETRVDGSAIQNAIQSDFYGIVDKIITQYPEMLRPYEHNSDSFLNSVQSVGMVALLHEKNIYSGYYWNDRVKSLNEASDSIAKFIATFPEKERKAVARVAWQQAAMSAELNERPEDIATSVKQAILQEDVSQLMHQAPSYLAQACGVKGYALSEDMRMMAMEWARSILLPQLLLDAGVNIMNWRISTMNYEKLADELLPVAGHLLFDGKTLDEKIKMAESWKIPGNSLPATLRMPATKHWQALTDKVETPYEFEGQKITIVPLTSHDDLVDEGRRLAHCLRGDSHASSEAMHCRNDYNNDNTRSHHMVSVRAGDRSLATCTLQLCYDSLNRGSFEGANRMYPPPAAYSAIDWYINGVNEGTIPLHEPVDGRWGAVKNPSDDERLNIEKFIGYYPEQPHVDACVQYYRDHVRIKHNSSIEGSKWKQAISDKPISQMIDDCGLHDRWQELRTIMRGEPDKRYSKDDTRRSSR